VRVPGKATSWATMLLLVLLTGGAIALSISMGTARSGAKGTSTKPAAATVSPPTSGPTSANEVVPIDTTTHRPSVPIPLDFLPAIMSTSPYGQMLYVAGDNRSGWIVVPIDTTTNRALPAIPVGMEPSDFAMTPNGKVLFVLDGGGDTAGAQGGDVIPIDTATDQPGPPILPNTAPTSMVMAPNGQTLYVTDDGSVYPIEVSTDQAGPRITIAGDAFYGQHAIAVTPDGRTVYVQSRNGNVIPIDTSTNLPGSPIVVGPAGPMDSDFVITPNGGTAYVLESNVVDVPQDDFAVLVPIDTGTNTSGPPIQVSPFSVLLALSPDGKTLYVDPSTATTNELTAINTQTNTVERVVRIPGPAVPDGMVFTPNSRTVYVADDASGTVTPIAVATNTVRRGIPAGTDPEALAITPNGETLYVLDVPYKSDAG
jgi:hyaluronoglucosaminidase